MKKTKIMALLLSATLVFSGCGNMNNTEMCIRDRTGSPRYRIYRSQSNQFFKRRNIERYHHDGKQLR